MYYTVVSMDTEGLVKQNSLNQLKIGVSNIVPTYT